jgi:holo-[acyl-carrier protein] synthase
MILGTGIDLIDIRRIADTLERHGARFKDRVFTQAEQDWCEKRSDKAAAYARHYAVKEACSKALGTGMAKGVAWRQMYLSREAGRRPRLICVGNAAERLRLLTPDGYQALLYVSITDEPPYAAATVSISAIPNDFTMPEQALP